MITDILPELSIRPAFVGFPKLSRLSREVCITEKIDGTNAQVFITPISKALQDATMIDYFYGPDASTWAMYAGSCTRWITPKDDNYGFARWVKEHFEELKKLGPGSHFGEWWGCGVQRTYGLKEKRFSLFNTGRWVKANPPDDLPPLEGKQEYCPGCCHVVPVLYRGPFDTNNISNVLWKLKEFGSVAAPGFMKPEGIVIFHTAAGIQFKKTLENDESPKSLAA